MQSTNIDELFAQTLDGLYDGDKPWEAVHSLRRIGNREVLERAVEWCASSDPIRRARGCDILAQLGKSYDHPSNSFPTESFRALSDVVRSEKEERPLSSGLFALGHLDDPGAIPQIVRFSRHESPEIRFAVACALGSFPNDPLSVTALLSLTEDDDDEVRDWATFAVGTQSDQDSDEIRDALTRRLGDVNPVVREEAIAGLAKRKDHRALHTLLQALRRDLISDCIFDVASDMLGIERREDWSGEKYATALIEKFGACDSDA